MDAMERELDGRDYGDAPELHRNLLLGSLQLMGWLIFHPAAWRSFVARIDPDLPPEFCLAQLRRKHLRKPDLWRLLLIGHLVWPVFGGTIMRIGGCASSASALAVVFAIVSGAIISTLSGVMAGTTFGVLFGIAVAACSGTRLLLCVSCIILGSVLIQNSEKKTYSFPRQFGGVLLGILWAVLWFFATIPLYDKSFSKNYHIINEIEFLTNFYGNSSVSSFGVILFIFMIFIFSIFVAIVDVGVAIILIFSMIVAIFILLGGIEGVGGGIGWLGITLGIVSSGWFAVSHKGADLIGGRSAGAIAGPMGGILWILLLRLNELHSLERNFIFAVFSIIIGVSQPLLRPVILYPIFQLWNFSIYRIDNYLINRSNRGLLHWNAAFWDEFQRFRLYGLDEHLLLLLERNPEDGRRALRYLFQGRQRWAVQAVQIEMDARLLEHCVDPSAIAKVHVRLAAGEHGGPASLTLRDFSRISQDISAALGQQSAYHQRLALAEVSKGMDSLIRSLTGSNDPHAPRFRPIAERWQRLLADHVRVLAAEAEQRQEIDNPYIIGLPLTATEQIFVGRVDVVGRIEQILLDRRRPPLLLYGQRRMGKTSLLQNLGRLLPASLIPMFADLQRISTMLSPAGFLDRLAQDMASSALEHRNLTLPPLQQEALNSDPFRAFAAWLDQVEAVLAAGAALLCLDEFECLERAFSDGRLPAEPILGVLRHLIQHRPRFKVLIAGSHTLQELKRWASYLINVQVVKLGLLREEEARQLIEHPVPDFPLRYAPGAAERVVALTRCHPYLVQLLCYEIVVLKNEHPPAQRRLAQLADVEEAIDAALDHGVFFFTNLEEQVSAGSVALLRVLASHGEGASVQRDALLWAVPNSSAAFLAELFQRDLIEKTDAGLRFQVELIRRYFARPM